MRNHTLTNATDTFVNITQPELKESHLNESTTTTTTLTNTTSETKPQLEPVHPSNTTNQSSSPTPSTEPIKNELNIADSSSDTNITNEGVTSTASPPSLTTPLNTHEIFPPTISSPWLKGMLVNTKSLPELFKIIEKLNFNLTLSNRYLQELSQHYVKKLDETQQTTDLLLKASKAADAQVRTGVRPSSLFFLLEIDSSWNATKNIWSNCKQASTNSPIGYWNLKHGSHWWSAFFRVCSSGACGRPVA